MLGRPPVAVKDDAFGIAAGRLAGIARCDADRTDVVAAARFADLAQAGPGGGAPDWVHLLPLGQIQAQDGRRAWHNADPAAVLAATRAIGRDLPVDYDHSIDAIKERGGTAPAAGWIKALELRADGIWGQVEWTERAKAAIAAKEWRFISPVFQFDKNSRAVLRILRAALTNDPAIAELKAVAHRTNSEDPMDQDLVKQLAKMLGLAETATEAEVRTALAAAQAKPLETAIATAAAASALAPIAKALGLAETAKPDEITTALATTIAAAKTPDPAKFSPIAVVTELQGRVATLETAAKTAAATSEVEAAIAAGKLIPAQREWGLDYAARDLAGFKAFIAKQPTILAGGRVVEGQPGGGADALTAEEKAVCAAMGLAEKDFLATKKQSLAETRA